MGQLLEDTCGHCKSRLQGPGPWTATAGGTEGEEGTAGEDEEGAD